MNDVGFGVLNSEFRGRDIGGDPGRLRPYMDKDVPCVTINTGKFVRDDKSPSGVKPERKQMPIAVLRDRYGINITGNAGTMRKEAYIMVDKQLHTAARYRQRAAADLKALSTFGGFNGMSKETLEYETMTDPGEAIIDMDGLTAGRTDQSTFGLSSLPLPITHVDLTYSQRRIDVLSNDGNPFTAQSLEWAGTRIGESIERQTIGTDTGIEFGTVASPAPTAQRGPSKVYGYITHPARITKNNLTIPTGANPNATYQDVLNMRQTMYNDKFYGPFIIYHSNDWDPYLDAQYAFTNGSNWAVNTTGTLRSKLKEIEGIQDVRRLDFLSATANPPFLIGANPFTLIMVQMAAMTARMVVGLGLTTVQWPSKGGMQQNWKVMCIEVPQLMYDSNGILAVQQGTTS